jgi:hypothetical protein
MRLTLLAIGLGLASLVSLATVACSSSGSGGSGGADGGCSGPNEQCGTGCNGETFEGECVNGVWTCPPEPGIMCATDASFVFVDAGDAGKTLTGDGGIDCVTTTCSAATQYCNISGGGVQLPDAGSNVSYECLTLPAMPCEAGTGCACIPDKCSCTDDGGAITNECFYP